MIAQQPLLGIIVDRDSCIAQKQCQPHIVLKKISQSKLDQKTFPTKRDAKLITSNRILEDWGKILGDQTAASAILDRLLHRGHLAHFEGKLWRLKEAAERTAIQKTLDSKTLNP